MKINLIQIFLLLISFNVFSSCNSSKRVIKASVNKDVSKNGVMAPIIEKDNFSKKDSLINDSKNKVIEEQPLSKDSIQIPSEEKTEKAITSNIHELWNLLLQKHVAENGFVNYAGLKKDQPILTKYLRILQEHLIDENASKEKKLAFWINVYNAYTVQLILNNYPVNSIKDIKDPWGTRFFKLGKKWYNLNDVEHKILRKMDEPRIHFAIVCASISCPKLQNTAFTAATLEKQLEEATNIFINDPTKNTIGEKRLELSLIFRWFSKDFKTKGSLISFIKPYVNTEITETTRISYQKYDWGLNGK
ncbi:DUF547 domain-containing protein [Ascidiimonas sp. W6]|uniref:DUF547 domain-containing protein n=1 Tax=Ascidiimonas meishanensis TaxID=3128903 RepID=UPI0030EC54A7